MTMNQFKASNSQKWVVERYLRLRQLQKSCFFVLSFSI